MNADPIKLRAVLGRLERLHERCSEELLRLDEARRELEQLDQELEEALPRDSDLFRIHDRERRATTDWWHETLSGYVSTEDCGIIARRIGTLRELLNRTSPDFLQRTGAGASEFYFAPGEVFRARQHLFHIFSSATVELLIVDPFLDPIVLDFVETVSKTVSVQLLTGSPKRLFVQQLKLLQGQRANLEARSSTASHDRWLALDGSEVWHLGASINGLGKSASRLSKVTEAAERDRVLMDTSAWWAAGVPI